MATPSTSSLSLSTLLCTEEEDEQEEEEEYPSLSTTFPDSEDEYFHLLLQRERKSAETHPICSSPCSFFDFKLPTIARLDAIHYILHLQDRLGFQFQTAYLAVTYLDRFLSSRILDCEKKWATELLSMGCLSLAAKIHECNVPGLSSFQLGSFRFEVKSIRKMELLILSTLEWRMDSVTPFAFLPYFFNNFRSEKITITRILELILIVMKDVSLMDHYPSAIASAAVLMTIDESLTRNELCIKINALPCSRFLDTDDVSVCYLIMQKLEKRKQTKILKLLTSPDVSTVELSHMGSLQNSSTTSSFSSSKRRRLTFRGH